MEIEYLAAKNQEQTVKIDSIFLHSSYNPSKEAERFVDSINVNFTPKYIFIFEPALGYTLPYLLKKFPNCKIGCFNSLNLNTNQFFDFEIKNINNFKSELKKYIPEEELFLTLFITWEPSQKLLTDLFIKYSDILKNAIEESKTILVTRQYFEKKWLLNSVNFIKYGTIFAKYKDKINYPIVICASGPSLKNVIPLLKKYRNKYFLICLSSAIYTLHKNNLIPDLYFSTDGGFWANFHLRKTNSNIPIAISPESFVNKNILKCNAILPIIYNDGFSSELNKYSDIHFYNGERNGTVSGTALKFALNFTTSKIYFAGLDLCQSNGHQHTQPNELEIKNCINDNRIKNLETRIYPSSLSNSSLEIYKNWFDQQFFSDRVFRIIENKPNTITSIIDISTSQFDDYFNKYSNQTVFNFEKYKRNASIIKKETKSFLKSIQSKLSDEKNYKDIFCLDYISYLRNPDNNEIKTKLQNESKKLLIKIEDILND